MGFKHKYKCEQLLAQGEMITAVRLHLCLFPLPFLTKSVELKQIAVLKTTIMLRSAAQNKLLKLSLKKSLKAYVF